MGLLLGKGGLGANHPFFAADVHHQQDADFMLEVFDQALRSL